MKKLMGFVLIIFILFGCSKPSEPISVNPRPIETTSPTDYQKVIGEMEKELGNDYIVEYLKLSEEASLGGFVIAGNITQAHFDAMKNGTIKNCAAAMYKDYFDKKPDYTLKVYLFEGASSYEAYVRKTEGREPSSPYGYYMDSSKSLIMNIGTGGGTLVHEMVHALIKPDFPDVPSWFNEGMGSLYEQCTVTDDGSLKGMINWRYPILMEAYNNNKLVPLKELFKTTDYEFYDKDKGTNYAQARYFCMYMQEKGILPKFYKKFRDNFEQDKTGTKFVVELLSGIPTNVGEELHEKTIDEIDKEWREWIPKIKEIETLR
jgi:hypothetical protein